MRRLETAGDGQRRPEMVRDGQRWRETARDGGMTRDGKSRPETARTGQNSERRRQTARDGIIPRRRVPLFLVKFRSVPSSDRETEKNVSFRFGQKTPKIAFCFMSSIYSYSYTDIHPPIVRWPWPNELTKWAGIWYASPTSNILYFVFYIHPETIHAVHQIRSYPFVTV